jgi:aspartyl protease family protein
VLLHSLKAKAGPFNPAEPGKVVEVLVDTGTIYSVVGRELLQQLGIKPIERGRFRVFGGYVGRDVGEVGLVILGRGRSVPVVFGEEKDISVVGVTALEIFGLEVC